MAPPINTWDWEHLRRALRERAARLKCDSRVHVRFDASDLTNETVKNALKAAQVPDGLNDEASQLHWLAAIQDNALMDLYRHATTDKGGDVRREQDLRAALQDSSIDLAQLAVDPSDLPPEKAERRERERLADEAIARLPPPQPDVFRLRKQGLTLETISEELGLPLPVVIGHYYRGLKKLKEQFGSDETSS